jgi:tripartite-type tricarboxylate transporter receptor subunit TctC
MDLVTRTCPRDDFGPFKHSESAKHGLRWEFAGAKAECSASPVGVIAAPRNTPAEIIEKLNKETNAALADPKLKAQVADMAATAFASSPAAFGKLITDESEKWVKVIRAANIKPG